MRYLIACDLDDTILNKKKNIPFKTRRYFKKMMKNGSLIVITSGRPYSGIYRYIKHFKNMPYIVSNGSAIYLKDKIITHDIDLNIFLDFYSKTKHMIHSFLDNVDLEIFTSNIIDIPDFLIHRETSGVKVNQGAINKILNKNLWLPNIWVYEKDIEEFTEILNKYHKYISYRNWGLYDGLYSFEMFSPSASKEKAILEIAKLSGIDEENIYAFGDSYNDESMLTSNKIKGIAMINAKEDLKEKAFDKTSKDFNHNGVIDYLKRHQII